MSRQISYNGQTFVVPDDATDDEITQIAGGGQQSSAPNAGLAPPAGAPPTPAVLSKNMDSGEGPIAQGMTTFERKFADLPGQLGAALQHSFVDKPVSDEKAGTTADSFLDPRRLNPVATNEGSPAMNAGATAANVLPFMVDPAGGGVMESPIAKLASAAKASMPMSADAAGKLFAPIDAAAAKTPIDTSMARQIAEEAQRYGDAGATVPPVIKKFLSRTEPTPASFPFPAEKAPDVLYPEGRLFSQNAGRLSVADNLAANPNMQRLVGKFAGALRDANRGAAEEVGMGDQYDQAMKAYSGAKGREQMLSNLGDIAKKAAIGMMGLEGAHQVYKAIRQ